MTDADDYLTTALRLLAVQPKNIENRGMLEWGASEVERLRSEVEWLRAENTRLADDREAYLFHEIYFSGPCDRWFIKALHTGPLLTRDSAVRRFIGHLYRFRDWPDEKRRRAEEAKRVAEE